VKLTLHGVLSSPDAIAVYDNRAAEGYLIPPRSPDKSSGQHKPVTLDARFHICFTPSFSLQNQLTPHCPHIVCILYPRGITIMCTGLASCPHRSSSGRNFSQRNGMDLRLQTG